MNWKMGFFRCAGRQVEQFKQTATETAKDSEGYRCQTCDERFYSEHDRCPNCGAEAVVPTTADE